MAGKGDIRRPQAVSNDELAQRWEKAFGGLVGLARDLPDAFADLKGNVRDCPQCGKPNSEWLMCQDCARA